MVFQLYKPGQEVTVSQLDLLVDLVRGSHMHVIPAHISKQVQTHTPRNFLYYSSMFSNTGATYSLYIYFKISNKFWNENTRTLATQHIHVLLAWSGLS